MCARAVLRRACTSHMRTDSADEVKHFRFVALWARRRASAVAARACMWKPTRNARCVNRFVTKPVDSSRAVAKTCARARAPMRRSTRTLRRRDAKRNLLRTSDRRAFSTRARSFTARSPRVRARLHAFRCAFTLTCARRHPRSRGDAHTQRDAQPVRRLDQHVARRTHDVLARLPSTTRSDAKKPGTKVPGFTV